jgi:tryptophanyl-tRNA synthetase
MVEVALDYLSAGLDPQKCTLYIQSRIPGWPSSPPIS